jgi:hypothetical protein
MPSTQLNQSKPALKITIRLTIKIKVPYEDIFQFAFDTMIESVIAQRKQKEKNRKCYMNKHPNSETYHDLSILTEEQRIAHKKQQKKEQKTRAKQRKLDKISNEKQINDTLCNKQQAYKWSLKDELDRMPYFTLANGRSCDEYTPHHDGKIYSLYRNKLTKMISSVNDVGYHELWHDPDGHIPDDFKDKDDFVLDVHTRHRLSKYVITKSIAWVSEWDYKNNHKPHLTLHPYSYNEHTETFMEEKQMVWC